MTILLGRGTWIQLTRGILAAAIALAVGVAAGAEKPAGDPNEVPATKWLPKPYPVPAAEAKTEAEMKPYAETLVDADIKFDMLPIAGGKFLMGSPASEKGRKPDEGPQVEVTVDPFWMGKHIVTWEEFETWAFELDKQRRQTAKTEASAWDNLADAIGRPTKPYTDMSFDMGKAKRPAICMTQYAARTYCKWLCAKTGRYYRLPTEAEWEYACRAGTTTAYSFGDDAKKLGEYAVYFDNSNDKYDKVGSKKPNPWGLYDMHGNVAQWTLDQYVADIYKREAGKKVVNPLSPTTEEYPCVVRGGSWQDDADMLRSAARRGSSKDWKKQDPQIPQSIWWMTDATFVGFRVVRPLRTPTAAEAKLYEPDPEIRKEYREAQGGKQ
jgi:formylglycine-generating enzyme required for sulfatase activity